MSYIHCMRKSLYLFIPLMFFCCETEKVNVREQYLGLWSFQKSYYESGMNGSNSGNYNFTGAILAGELENELIIPISGSPYSPSTIKLTVDNDGALFNFEQNFSEDYTIDSVVTYFIGIDSIYLYYKVYVPSAMFITEISGKKIQ